MKILADCMQLLSEDVKRDRRGESEMPFKLTT